MVKKFKTGLSRVSTKLQRFMVGHGDKHWPTNVLNILETKYHLLPKDLLRLWYVRHRLVSSQSRMDSIFIYDQARASDRNLSIREYSDLYKYPDLLMYKGYISGNGEVRIERTKN